MKESLLSLIFVTFVTSIWAGPHYIQTVEGGALYLMRSGVETHRAEFLYPGDCKHIAKIMNEAEPLVRWYCSTSTPAINYSCRLKNIHVKNTDTGKSRIEDMDFTMSLNRKKASTSLTSAISSFNYEKSGQQLKLTNDYPYVNGNYFSRAVYKITIDIRSGNAVISDINMEKNGEGVCRKQ